MESEEAANAISAGDEVEVDFDTGVITDITTGQTFQAAAFPPFLQNIISAGGSAQEPERKRGQQVMQYNIAVIKGDGIGPEIVTEAMKARKLSVKSLATPSTLPSAMRAATPLTSMHSAAAGNAGCMQGIGFRSAGCCWRPEVGQRSV